jgi:hypothetical protein
MIHLPAAIANSLWFASNLPAWVKFRDALQRPAETQLRLLQCHLYENRDCAYGKAHGFDSISNYEQFAKGVPLSDYDSLEPWIDRIVNGEPRVLTRQPVSHLVPTSGSSGPRKLIPFTVGLQNEFNRAIGPWIVDLYWQQPSVLLGSSYWAITPTTGSVGIVPASSESPFATGQSPRSVRIGFDDDAAYLGGVRKTLVRAVMAVPRQLQHVPDMDVFKYVTLLCLLRRPDLRLISVWHPSFLRLLLETLETGWENLLHDIETGGCRNGNKMSAPVLQALNLRPMPQRTAELTRAKPRKPETIWPQVRVISCWGDGNAENEADSLQEIFPQALIQRKGLLATEAFVTIPFAGSTPIAIRSHFFEFMDEQGRFHLAHQLREGPVYEVIVTTAGGLWRYRLHDQVQVTGFLGKTPSLRFLGRKGNISDRCGEKLSEAFVAQALQKALGGLAAIPRFTLLAPDKDDFGYYYTLYLEGEAPECIAVRVESELRANPNYAVCRDLGQLQPVRLFRVKRGHEIYIRRQLTAGRRLGDIKACPLSCETEWRIWFKAGVVPNQPAFSSIQAPDESALPPQYK